MWPDFITDYFWEFILMAILLLWSAFFSGTETSLFNLPRGTILRLSQGSASGKLVASLMRKPRRILNTILLGNMLVNIAFASTSAGLILRLEDSGASALILAAAPIISLAALILIGEVTPKMIAFVVCDKWALVAAYPISIIRRILSPVLLILENLFVTPLTRIFAPQKAGIAGITDEEFNALLDLSAKRGVIDHDASALLQEIVELTDLKVSDIMAPRVDMIAYNVKDSSAGLMGLVRKTNLRRIPVYKKNIDYITGIVDARNLLLNPERPLTEMVEDVLFIPETAAVEKALIQFRSAGQQLAIAVDEYGGTAGLLSLEDILEEIVGDIPDSEAETFQEGPAVKRLGKKEYLLDANLPIHEWTDAFKMELASERISTVGGFVISLIGKIPQPGDVASYRNLRFTIESMRGRRIGKLRVAVLQEGKNAS